MSAADMRRIAVIGAGIGGLTLAIALRRYGSSVNATRFFEQFGLTQQLASHWFAVSHLIFRDGWNGSIVGKHQVGAAYRQRFGAPVM